MKAICISDTHLYDLKDTLKDQKADLLIHAGDALNYGYLKEFYKFHKQLKAVREQFKHVIYVPGNHDISVEKFLELCRGELASIDVDMLVNNLIEIEGVTFYGSPYIPIFPGWAFRYEGREEAERRWANVPDCDVLITHGPPFGVLDGPHPGRFKGSYGCMVMKEMVLRIKPKIHIFGHIHQWGGCTESNKDTDFYNVAICTEDYDPENSITHLEIPSKSVK